MQIHQSKVNVKFVFLVPGNAWPQLPGLGKWKVQTESLNLLLHPCLPCIPGIGTLLLRKKFVFYGVVRIRIVQISFMYFNTGCFKELGIRNRAVVSLFWDF